MDQNLHQAMQQHPFSTPDTADSQPRSHSSMSVIYALVLLVALGWGLQAHSALQHSRAEIVQLQAEQDRTQRLGAQPDRTAPLNHRTSPTHHAHSAL
jgi:hypothetical protein